MAQNEQPKGRANDMVNLSKTKKKSREKEGVQEFKTHKQHDTSRQSVKRGRHKIISTRHQK